MLYRKLLVVDDDKDILQLMEKRLTAEGYIVLRANRGMEAVERAKKEHPDLIIMDIVLPDVDGSEAVKMIHSDPATQDIPVVFISGILSKDESGQTRTDIKVAGAKYSALSKPFSFDSLLKEIERIFQQ